MIWSKFFNFFLFSYTWQMLNAKPSFIRITLHSSLTYFSQHVYITFTSYCLFSLQWNFPQSCGVFASRPFIISFPENPLLLRSSAFTEVGLYTSVLTRILFFSHSCSTASQLFAWNYQEPLSGNKREHWYLQ